MLMRIRCRLAAFAPHRGVAIPLPVCSGENKQNRQHREYGVSFEANEERVSLDLIRSRLSSKEMWSKRGRFIRRNERLRGEHVEIYENMEQSLLR
eukprot:750568-Hanusia_phi.AAC.4